MRCDFTREWATIKAILVEFHPLTHILNGSAPFNAVCTAEGLSCSSALAALLGWTMIGVVYFGRHLAAIDNTMCCWWLPAASTPS